MLNVLECLALVNLLDETRRKWKAAVAEVEELKADNVVLQERLKFCQLQLSIMMKDAVHNRRRKSEADVSMTLSTIDSDDESAEMNIDVPEQNTGSFIKTLEIEAEQKQLEETPSVIESTTSPESPSEEKINTFAEEAKLRRSVSLPGLVLAARNSVSSISQTGTLDITRCTSAVYLHAKNQPKRYQDIVEKRPHQFGVRRIFTKLSCMACKENFRFGNEASRCKGKSILWQFRER